jgi:hypothetical protein
MVLPLARGWDGIKPRHDRPHGSELSPSDIDGFMVMVKIVVMAKIASVWLLVVACQSVPAITGVGQSHLHLSSTDTQAEGFPAVA